MKAHTEITSCHMQSFFLFNFFYRRICYMFLMIKRVVILRAVKSFGETNPKALTFGKSKGSKMCLTCFGRNAKWSVQKFILFLVWKLPCNVEKLAYHIENDYNIRNLPNFIFSPINLAFLLPKPAPRPINLRIKK